MLTTIQNYIQNANNCIKTTRYKDPFFKIIMSVPVVGQIVQVWKREALYAELNEMQKEPKITAYPVPVGFDMQKDRNARPSAFKSIEILNLNVNSFYYGIVADVASGIAGIALMHFSLPVGGGVLAFGLSSLCIRKIAELGCFDTTIRKQYNTIPPSQTGLK